MRKVLIFCIAVFVVLLIFPVATSFLSGDMVSFEKNETTNVYEGTNDVIKAKEKEKIIRLAMSICSEEFCDEGLKAALCLAKNNLRYSENFKNNTDSLVTYSDEFFKRVSKIYEDVDVSLTYKEDTVYIPTASLSKGFTATDEKYPYMKSVASPWDCICEDFVYKKEYAHGISLWGINFLCEEGLNYKEALRWYLPAFEIK